MNFFSSCCPLSEDSQQQHHAASRTKTPQSPYAFNEEPDPSPAADATVSLAGPPSNQNEEVLNLDNGAEETKVAELGSEREEGTNSQAINEAEEEEKKEEAEGIFTEAMRQDPNFQNIYRRYYMTEYQ